MNFQRRVVITGLGLITPVGLDVPSTWSAILNGKSGVRPITSFDVTDFPVKIAGTVENFDPDLYIDAKQSRKLDIFIQYGVAASVQAILDAGLDSDKEDLTRIGVLIGAGIGGLPNIEANHCAYLEKGPRRISPGFIPNSIINMASGIVSIKYGYKGPGYAVVSACATGTHSIGDAARIIGYGDADVMICGGAESATVPLGIGGFAQARALSRRNDEPEKASRPWDKDRDGFVMGEGAGVVVLEEYEHAKKRGAKIYAELLGFGMSADAYHVTAVDSTCSGPMRSMQNAVADAKLPYEAIDYINAHGTSTVLGDPLEIMAIKGVFGEHAYKLAVSSTKSMTGHLLGATGAAEAIFSILAIRDNVIPPTINLDNPDEGCDLDLVPHTAREQKVDAALSNSFGFGGTNATLVFTRV